MICKQDPNMTDTDMTEGQESDTVRNYDYEGEEEARVEKEEYAKKRGLYHEEYMEHFPYEPPLGEHVEEMRFPNAWEADLWFRGELWKNPLLNLNVMLCYQSEWGNREVGHFWSYRGYEFTRPVSHDDLKASMFGTPYGYMYKWRTVGEEWSPPPGTIDDTMGEEFELCCHQWYDANIREKELFDKDREGFQYQANVLGVRREKRPYYQPDRPVMPLYVTRRKFKTEANALEFWGKLLLPRLNILVCVDDELVMLYEFGGGMFVGKTSIAYESDDNIVRWTGDDEEDDDDDDDDDDDASVGTVARG